MNIYDFGPYDAPPKRVEMTRDFLSAKQEEQSFRELASMKQYEHVEVLRRRKIGTSGCLYSDLIYGIVRESINLDYTDTITWVMCQGQI
jgi:hypothetical protein